MSSDLDSALRDLGSGPTHPGLAGLEASVFARIASAATPMPARLGIGIAALAGMMGLLGAGVPMGAATAAPAPAPFGMASALAPSTLLIGR